MSHSLIGPNNGLQSLICDTEKSSKIQPPFKILDGICNAFQNAGQSMSLKNLSILNSIQAPSTPFSGKIPGLFSNKGK